MAVSAVKKKKTNLTLRLNALMGVLTIHQCSDSDLDLGHWTTQKGLSISL